eukprot:TRINITY_DN4869_c0_g2_i1.p1 TRINITY_DN4869_c0_g2~~TRINITY_DN4869_c0_g2_i1.p1  ORF type:complete len:107 (+),score=0.81 TRINITY_DN4869_c0_g2_i1:174-494(+)
MITVRVVGTLQFKRAEDPVSYKRYSVAISDAGWFNNKSLPLAGIYIQYTQIQDTPALPHSDTNSHSPEIRGFGGTLWIGRWAWEYPQKSTLYTSSGAISLIEAATP